MILAAQPASFFPLFLFLQYLRTHFFLTIYIYIYIKASSLYSISC